MKLQVCGCLLFVVDSFGHGVSRCIRTSARQFDYPHAFVSADVQRRLVPLRRLELFHLRGVPVDNNPPIAAQDFYTHWPPLLPILLSICFRAFGVSERVAHLLMLAIFVITALLILRMGFRWLGVIGGAMAGFFWLTLPVTLQFGHLVSQQALMMMFMVAGILELMEDRNLLAAVLFFFGTLSSWEIVLVAPGLLLASHWNPELRRKAAAVFAGTGIGVAFVAALYLIASPTLAVDALRSAKFYMGLSPEYSHFLPPQIQISAHDQIIRMLLNNVWMLGPLALGAILVLFMERRHLFLLASLSAPWLFWCMVMRNHMARHHFEFVLASPLAALALAWMATTQTQRPTLKACVFAALAGIQILLLHKPVIGDAYDSSALIRYAKEIEETTEPDAIIMAPLISSVPLFYSDRHIVRGVGDAKSATLKLKELSTEFPNSPIYLAIPPQLAANLSRENAVAFTSDAAIYKLHTSTSLSGQ